MSAQPTERGDTMPRQPVSPQLRANAKRMRKDMTEMERRLWNQIRAHRLMGLGFRRQMPVAGYIADFACPQHRLIVELDGTQHAEATAMVARNGTISNKFVGLFFEKSGKRPIEKIRVIPNGSIKALGNSG